MTIRLHVHVRGHFNKCSYFHSSYKTAGKILTVEIPPPNPPATCSVATVNTTTRNTPLTTSEPAIIPSSDQSQTCDNQNALSELPDITNSLDSTRATPSRARLSHHCVLIMGRFLTATHCPLISQVRPLHVYTCTVRMILLTLQSVPLFASMMHA